MILEVLISTMNQKDLSFLDSMFANNNISKFKILIINQTSGDVFLKSSTKDIRVINSKEFGLSKSRNLAIKNAQGDVCLVTDDDVVFVDGFDQIIKNAFVNYPNSSIIKFKIETFSGVPYKIYPSKSKYLQSFRSIIGVSSIEIAFRRIDILEKKISFNEYFGLGAHFPSGEEYLFLREALKKKIKIFFQNTTIVKHPKEHSTSNMAENKFIKTKAAIFYQNNNYVAYLVLLKFIFFLVRTRQIKIQESFDKMKIGLNGIKEFKKIERGLVN